MSKLFLPAQCLGALVELAKDPTCEVKASKMFNSLAPIAKVYMKKRETNLQTCDIDSLLLEVGLSLIKHLQNHRSVDNWEAFLANVMNNQIKKHFADEKKKANLVFMEDYPYQPQTIMSEYSNEEEEKLYSHIELEALIKKSKLRLTKKEHEIILLLYQGKDKEFIAQKLNISVGTVENHIRHIQQKKT